jgi:hypothetical protein
VFNAFDTTGDAGIWTGSLGSNLLVAHVGMPAAGTGGQIFSSIEGPEINANGQVAFKGSIQANSASGIWATDADGVLQLVAREGNTLTVGPGDTRQIVFLSFQYGGGNEDGLASSLNDSGVLTFHAAFTDGSAGVFTASLGTLAPISSIQKIGNDIQINVPTALNHTYQLGYKDNLTDQNWTPLGAPANGTGNVVTLTDIGAGSLTKRFYHVVQH